MEPNETGGFSDEHVVLRERVEQLESELARFRQDEEFLVQTLVSAARHASELRDSAKAEGEIIVREATAEAERRTAVLEGQRRAAAQELARLQQIAEETRQGLSSLLTTLLGELHAEPVEGLTAEAPANEVSSASSGGELDAALEERMQSVIEPELVAILDAEAAPLADETSDPE